jgi:hypothetical protein
MIACIAVVAERAKVKEDGKLEISGVYNCRFSPELPAQMEVTLALRHRAAGLWGGAEHLGAHHG